MIGAGKLFRFLEGYLHCWPMPLETRQAQSSECQAVAPVVSFDTFVTIVMAHQSDLMLPTLRRYGSVCHDFLSKHTLI